MVWIWFAYGLDMVWIWFAYGLHKVFHGSPSNQSSAHSELESFSFLQMVLNPDDPPDEDPALHWHDREPCPFSREEGEVYGTYVSSDMSRV